MHVTSSRGDLLVSAAREVETKDLESENAHGLRWVSDERDDAAEAEPRVQPGHQ